MELVKTIIWSRVDGVVVQAASSTPIGKGWPLMNHRTIVAAGVGHRYCLSGRSNRFSVEPLQPAVDSWNSRQQPLSWIPSGAIDPAIDHVCLWSKQLRAAKHMES